MLMYTVLINSAFAFLIVLALILTGGGPVAQPVLLNFIFYVIFAPIIATAMSKVMYMSENGMIVADALHDVTIRAGAGETVALIGPSGGGKTTIAGSISRFWDVTDGAFARMVKLQTESQNWTLA